MYQWYQETYPLLDVKVRRGADVGRNRHLVVVVLKVKLRKTGSRKVERVWFDVKKSKDPEVKSAFVLQLKNRFQALADMKDHTYPDNDVVNNRWEHVEKAYPKTSEACLGKKEKRRKEWIMTDTWQIIEKTESAKKAGDGSKV